MKPTTLAAAVLAMAVTLPTLSLAGPIDSACLRSERSSANARTCACIQAAADATLSRADQRKAARFFTDPDRAQEVRVSKGAADSAFWQRYRAFGRTAEAYCS
ncbi:hypothetical protein [Falsirhodobacter halotolerans]|uniref:hypothetical protein n=1 Tax=Falsirhodobacter halotolerans TaxID=1146892 RepID=UPI001FD58E1C|nr:hypothetical protein [Falsirhodobacter halotolerans]MCJ8139850.1 hypothetical protein [Falsirhodobacter halotolerans]